MADAWKANDFIPTSSPCVDTWLVPTYRDKDSCVFVSRVLVTSHLNDMSTLPAAKSGANVGFVGAVGMLSGTQVILY